MINTSINIRPYTKAIFALAVRNKQLTEWQKALDLLALITTECEKKYLLSDPNITYEQKIGFFSDVTTRFPAATNLVQFLAERKKLKILPKIATDYYQLFLEQEQILEANVTSACELTYIQKEQLIKALQNRYQHKILLKHKIDKKLIGGIVIDIAGQTIDGTIKGMLQQLKQELITLR